MEPNDDTFCCKSTCQSNDSSEERQSLNLQSVAALQLPRYYYPPGSSCSTELASQTTSAPLSPRDVMITKRRKELFGDCALIEIIHLHDCLRGALKSLQEDVKALTQQIIQDSGRKECCNAKCPTIESNKLSSPTYLSSDQQSAGALKPELFADHTDWIELERSVAGRFKVIWSVFRAHSSAEDEFIWPALRSKMQPPASQELSQRPSHPAHGALRSANNTKNSPTNPASAAPTCGCGAVSTGLVQEEYEEDHADEERMFSEMDTLLKKLRGLLSDGSHSRRKTTQNQNKESSPPVEVEKHKSLGADGTVKDSADDDEANAVAQKIRESTRILSDHLMRHLEKEETQCMPLVVKHLSKAEIHDLVGNIMGKRSADTIAQIMTMAVQSLAENERQEMIQYMKQSMQNTFFDRWLSASGWGSDTASCNPTSQQVPTSEQDTKPSASASTENTNKRPSVDEDSLRGAKRTRSTSSNVALQSASIRVSSAVKNADVVNRQAIESPKSPNHRRVQITSQAELEKLIRAIATNPALNPQQKNATIQGLRDSVWKSNEREKQRCREPDSPPVVAVNAPLRSTTFPFLPQQLGAPQNGNNEVQQRPRVSLPPSAYYKKTGDSKVEVIWKNDGLPLSRARLDSAAAAAGGNSIPLFSAAELAPTFHDGATGAVLGCPHYARACKLRHPKSGRLYTCRLCCDQARELPMIRGGAQEDEKLDRYAVTEVMCMTCNALQPAEDRCIHPDCESYGKPFAKYFCRICHLYDGSSRPIFHCPYCNTCRLGLGLGIDFRHCMRCNACVSLEDKEHQCIPQKLQGSCPICHDMLFQSTEPLRGLKCGHVMHMTCFTQYRRTSYTCPLCMRSVEDMKDHFALLDAAIRMQPMPASFLYTMSNIYCQDCGKTGQVQYHFVGQKCPHCNSYNTREMGRVHNSPGT
ncbi:hypothetical protein ACA910_003176 [Epithemia clementina (nom. ined.)]